MDTPKNEFTRNSLHGFGMAARPHLNHQMAIMHYAFLIKASIVAGKYFVVTEAAIDPNNLDSLAPDIVIFTLNKRNAVEIFEVVHSAGLKEVENKLRILFKDYPLLKQASVYNYETKQWYEFNKNKLQKVKQIESIRYTAVLK